MAQTLVRTDFHFPGQDKVYHGKVRDVYFLDGERIAMIATDRISAFDVVLPKGIPYKGQVLNQIATYFLEATKDIVPNWLLSTPDPMVSLGHRCEPFRVEMVIRGYLTGSAWRAYKAGERTLCGIQLPEGMRENEAFPEPIIPPRPRRTRATTRISPARRSSVRGSSARRTTSSSRPTPTHSSAAGRRWPASVA